MDIRLICMDLDGTLFGSGNTIPERNKRALIECERRGIRLALVSGRGYRFMKRVADEIGIQPFIASANGSRIDEAFEDRTIFEGTFEPAWAKSIAGLLLQENINFEAYTRGINYVAKPELMPERHRASLMSYVNAGDVQVVYDEEQLLLEATQAAYKFVLFSQDEHVIERMRGFLDEKGIEHCSSSSKNIEIMPPGVDKGSALRCISEYLGIDRGQTMAFGDFTNDISMLKAAGHAVAMGNALSVVKAHAEIIAPPNTEGGLGTVIFEYVLKGK